MKPCVYILQSVKNTRYYVGSTDNIKRRFHEHFLGNVASTKKLRPLVLKCVIICTSLSEARSAELRLKKYKSRKILEKVILDSTFPWKHKRG